MTRTAYIAAHVLAAADEPVRPRSAVLVDGDRIVAVTGSREVPPVLGWPRGLRHALLTALGSSPSARAGHVTRRRLAGTNPWWIVPLWTIGMALAVGLALAGALVVSLAIGTLK